MGKQVRQCFRELNEKLRSLLQIGGNRSVVGDDAGAPGEVGLNLLGGAAEFDRRKQDRRPAALDRRPHYGSLS